MPGNDNSDYQLTKADRWVVAVPQQLRTHHSTGREPFSYLTVDEPRDLFHIQATSRAALAFQDRARRRSGSRPAKWQPSGDVTGA
jgi:hypothetical protein